jgi:hypothetical protein
MKAKSEPALRVTLRNIGYSKNATDKILKWYTPAEKSKSNPT